MLKVEIFVFKRLKLAFQICLSQTRITDTSVRLFRRKARFFFPFHFWTHKSSNEEFHSMFEIVIHETFTLRFSPTWFFPIFIQDFIIPCSNIWFCFKKLNLINEKKQKLVELKFMIFSKYIYVRENIKSLHGNKTKMTDPQSSVIVLVNQVLCRSILCKHIAELII